MKRILLILLLSLCGLTPAQKRLLVSEPSCDQIIRQAAPTLWLDAEYGITESATAVSAWASRVSAVSFTQGTGANQPVTTRRDNRENRLPTSGDFTGAAWTATNVGVSGATVTATNSDAAHRLASTAGYRPLVVAGGIYVMEFDIAYSNYDFAAVGDSGDSAWHSCAINLNTGAAGTCSGATMTIATIGTKRYRVTLLTTAYTTAASTPYITLAKDATSYRNDTTWAAAGTEAITLNSAAFRSNLADDVYLATVTTAAYRGLNGRRAVRFDGSNDGMTSATVASALFGAAAKTIFFVSRVNTTAGTQDPFITDNGAYFGVKLASTNWTIRNYDGNADTAVSAGLAADAPTVVVGTHDGTTINVWRNGNLGTPAASGNSSDLTGTLALGAYVTGTTNYFNGSIAELQAYNKVLGADQRNRIQKCLCKKWGASC